MEAATLEHLNRRAGKNIGGVKMQHPGETPGKGYDEAITRAVRGNSVIQGAPTTERTYGKPRATA
jgi:hypothetical protein